MLVKLIDFALVYLLTVLNFFVILSPVTFTIAVIAISNLQQGMGYLRPIIFLSIAAISFCMLLLMFLDYLFGFSVSKYLITAIYYKRSDKYAILDKTFKEVRDKFHRPNVKLYIQPSTEINAFAIGSLRKNAIVITTGLLEEYERQTANQDMFLRLVQGVMAHEMSHLVHKDYLPPTLLSLNETATFFISKIIFVFFRIFIFLLGHLPLVGEPISNILLHFYNILDGIINFFYAKIILKLHSFIQLQLCKSIEYRCDRQAAKVCGGSAMAMGLSLLGDNGYFTLFSTHPSTKSRMKKVKEINVKNGRIGATFGSNFVSACSLLLIVATTLISLKLSNVPKIVRGYRDTVYKINDYSIRLKYRMSSFLNSLR